MTTQERNIVIAEYDGWEYTAASQSFPDGYLTKKEPGKVAINALPEELPYHTDIALLWHVAGRVKEELDNLYKIRSDLRSTLLLYHSKISNAASSFNHPALFTAVSDAIVFINGLKTQGV